MSPATFIMGNFDAIRRYLLCLDHAFQPTVIVISTVPFTFFFGWLFVFHLDYEITGVGLTILCTHSLSFILIFLLVQFGIKDEVVR